MPLTFAEVGSENFIIKVGGKEDVRKHLETLGFVVGACVTIVSKISGNVIVNVKESRIALDREMANKIFV